MIELATVLIVDDNENNLHVLEGILREVGYVVRSATSGPIALKSIERALPDLILLDIRMPHMDGFSVCQILKAQPHTRDIPVLFISASSDIEDKVRGFDVGGVDYITKPFSSREVLSRVRTHIRLSRMERDLRHEVIRVLTREVDLRAQLEQAQRLEALGTLAGGIAHDFNNILGAVAGYAELLCQDVAPNTPSAEDARQILTAARRAKDLVAQLLTFSRTGRPKPEPIAMQTIVREALQLLRTTLPNTVIVETHLNTEGMVLANPTQIHQVVVNLCTNAAHAMGSRGGRIEVVLDTTVLDEVTATTARIFRSGTYVRLSVTDNGCGIPPEIRARLFEPFFTARKDGTGTGLGLSVVHEIVTRASGLIRVKSEEGRGSTFEILLPQLDQGEEQPSSSQSTVDSKAKRILFVDNELPLVELTQRTLSGQGYDVVAVSSSREALMRFREAPESFDLAITDVSMSESSETTLLEELRRIRPDLPVVLLTGHSDHLTIARVNLLRADAVIPKPLLPSEMGELIRHLLDRNGRNSTGASPP